MTFAHPVPWWAFAATLAAAAGLAWLAYRGAPLRRGRRVLLGALRFCTLLLLVVLLLRPTVAVERAGEQAVLVLVDTSRSMSIADAGGTRRIDRARQLVDEDLRPVLAGRFLLDVAGLDRPAVSVATSALAATAPRTDLVAGIRALIEHHRGRQIAGVVLVSDGGDTGTAGRVDTLPVPVFTLGVGTATAGRDREVLSVTTAESVLDRSRVDVAVTAVSHGHGRDPIELRLQENGTPIDVRRVAPAGESVPVTTVFQVTPDAAAENVYTVEIPAAAGEVVPENNVRSVLVPAASRARRVLLVQGAPGFEHSFLQRAWSGDPGLELDSVVRKGQNEQGADTFYVQAGARAAGLAAGFPASAEALFAYDAVVLANVDPADLAAEQLQQLRDFVGRRGGGLLVLGAQSFARQGMTDTPLADLLPLDPADRGRGVQVVTLSAAGPSGRVSLTAEGEAHPIMQLGSGPEESRKRWQAVPALAAVSALGGPRPGASVLAVTTAAGGGSRPLVAVQRYGDGRTLVFTGEGAWRWRMQLPALDRSYETFWRQAVRWLAMPASAPIFVTGPAEAAPGEEVTWQVQVRDPQYQPLTEAVVQLRVTGPDHRTDVLSAGPLAGGSPGTFAARHRPAQRGVYRASADVRVASAPAVSARATLLVGGADREMTDPRLNARVLQNIAQVSGGRMLEPGDLARLPQLLRDAMPAAALTTRRDLWHTPWSFALIVLLLGAEWTLRRAWGLR